MFTSRMVKVFTTESICVNFPRTANKDHKDRTIPILKFSTQHEKKCFSQSAKKISYTCVSDTTCSAK